MSKSKKAPPTIARAVSSGRVVCVEVTAAPGRSCDAWEVTSHATSIACEVMSAVSVSALVAIEVRHCSELSTVTMTFRDWWAAEDTAELAAGLWEQPATADAVEA